jgi:hypothetical protein
MINRKLLGQLRHLLMCAWVTAMCLCLGVSIFFIGVAIRAMIQGPEVKTGIEYLLDAVTK